MSSYKVTQCQRMKMNGSRCGSPALRNKKFCYFHERCSAVQFDVSTSAAEPAALFFLPVLEDAASIQATITQVCHYVLHRKLDPKKAGIVLYALQVASSNLDRLNRDRSQYKSEDDNQRKSEENNRQNQADAASPAPAPSVATSTGQDSPTSIASREPDRLPPGTIQACEQPRRFAV